MFKHFGILAVVIMVLNLLVALGVIYFFFWCVKHFGLIG